MAYHVHTTLAFICAAHVHDVSQLIARKYSLYISLIKLKLQWINAL